MQRISKENYYLNIAQTVLERATCLRRVYGAIIVKNSEIISTGYNGAPRGRRNCVDMGYCTRERLQVPGGSGTSCAAASTPRPTPSSPPAAGTWWAAPCTWWAATPRPGSCCRTPPLAPCAAATHHQRGPGRVVIRRTPTEFQVVDVQDWIDSEDDVPQA